MFSFPHFSICLALVFATRVNSRAFPLAKANDDARNLQARQVVTSATATATNAGSLVGGEIASLLAAGASASVAAVQASAAAVVSSNNAVDAICNGPSNRNQTGWNKFDMGDWFKNKTKFYTVNNWNNVDGTPVQNIQFLELNWASDGENPCGLLSTDCNPNPQYSQCLLYPQANFLWFATATFSNYLGNMAGAVKASNQILTDYTGTMVTEFYTPQTPPTKLIAPISVIVGVAAAISSFWPPAAVVAGIGSVASGLLIQNGLAQASPLMQWTDVMAQLGNMTEQTVNFIQSYWTTQLDTQPSRLNSAGLTYDEDPTALPAILASGGFADSRAANVGNFPNGIFGALGSAGINTLWNEDKAFILKLSDKTLGQGAGAACKQFPTMTYCDPDGVAWLFMRWIYVIGPAIANGKINTILDKTQWQVWGAYDSLPGNAAGNANHLGKYGLDLGTITRSAWRVQQAYGFWTEETPQATIASVQADITNLSLDRIVSWNMLVCDLDAILNGAHFVVKDTTWTAFIGCACGTMKDINGKAFPLPPPPSNVVPPAACTHGWST